MSLPIQLNPVLSSLYPGKQSHLNDPSVLIHLPFLQRSGLSAHSLISENITLQINCQHTH
jgi:hypothetical protein